MRSLCFIVFLLVAIIFTPTANGQCNQSYGGFSSYRSTPRAQAPYFVKHPPVYYSHSVKRPYGVSPYAVNQGGLPPAVTHPFPRTNPTVKRTAAEAVPTAISPRRSSTTYRVTPSRVTPSRVTPSRVLRGDNSSRGWRTNPHYN